VSEFCSLNVFTLVVRKWCTEFQRPFIASRPIHSRMASSPYIVTFAVIVLFSGMADLSIVLEGNGYSNIVVAISKDIPQPADNGIELIDKLKVKITVSYI
jgi:hypothetical protein